MGTTVYHKFIVYTIKYSFIPNSIHKYKKVPMCSRLYPYIYKGPYVYLEVTIIYQNVLMCTKK